MRISGETEYERVLMERRSDMSTFSMNLEKAMFLEMFISMAATTTPTTTTLTSEDWRLCSWWWATSTTETSVSDRYSPQFYNSLFSFLTDWIEGGTDTRFLLWAWGTLVSLHLEWHCVWLVYSVREYSPLKGIGHYREEGMIEWERNLSTQSSPPCQPDSWEGGIKCKYPRGDLYPKPRSD